MTEGILLRAASLVEADMLVAARFAAGDPFDYLETRDRRILVVTDFEAPRALRESGADEVWTHDDLGLGELYAEGLDRGSAMRELTLRAVRRAGLDRVVVPGWLEVATADYLRRAGIEVHVEPELLTERRRRKDAVAVDAIRQAQAAAQRTLGTVRDLLASADVGRGDVLVVDGGALTSERVQAAIRGQWAEEGYEGELPIVACGPASADPHDSGSGSLRAHQPIICDLFPRHALRRFYGDVTRTFCVGEPPAELVELHAAVVEALEASIAACRAGLSGAELNRIASDLLLARGYRSVLHPADTGEQGAELTHSLGHGVGLDVHEAPSLGVGGRDPLVAGDAVTIEPGLYRPGFGGVRVEDLVIVTEDGCENLTSFPYGLEVR